MKKMKMNTIAVILMIVAGTAMMFACVHTSPLPTVDTADDSNETMPRIVITHIIKTIEFDVGVLDDEDNSTSTDEGMDDSTENYVETDIKLLDPQLLSSILQHAKYLYQQQNTTDDDLTDQETKKNE